jgi:hypothetical protein
MSHPFLSLSPHRLTRLFWPLLAITLGLAVVMAVAGVPLNTPAAHQGLVSFEFAGSVARAAQILASWDAPAQLRAAFIQGLDCLYLLVYSTTIGLGCIWAGRFFEQRGWSLGAVLGAPLAWGMGLAAACDAVENIALVVLLFGRLVSPWPEIAWICAAVKFTLIFIGLVYIFIAAVLRLTSR